MGLTEIQKELLRKEGGGEVFASVTFSPADLSRIEIPSSISRLEDQTLAYCFKYWNLVEDLAFERIVFLYSRKYGKKNHEVYILIRQGKRAKHQDDKILGAVMASLVQGYYYSVLGDRYLQQKWIALKNILMEQDASALAARSVASAAAGISLGGTGTAVKKKQAPRKDAVKKNVTAVNPAPVQKKRYPRALPAAARPSVERAAGGSVSDRLRVLSGRSYDLYQDRFLTNARPAIRKVLSAGKGIFFNLPEKAEDMVYNFLRDHYADPYMNWAESRERAELAGFGLTLESLNPVIDECFKSVKN